MITVVLCTTGKLSAKPSMINMKIGATPSDVVIESVNNNAYKRNIYRFTRSNAVPIEESKIMRIIDIQRTPRMLGNERGARLHIANGAYPVYYSIARANGQFGKHIRALVANE